MPTVKRKERLPTQWQRPTTESQFALGPPPFSPRDAAAEVDGQVVDGVLIRRAPDGSLVGIVPPKDKGR